MEDNSIMYGLLVGLAIVIFLLLMWDSPAPNDEATEPFTMADNCQKTEAFTMADNCDEMFHQPDYLAKCKSRSPNGQLRYGPGIQYAYPKYLKNKQDKVELPEDLYWAHVANMGGLGRLGKCHTVFWNDESMVESCASKPKPIVDALHVVYWHNRMNDIEKSPEQYQHFLNSGTDLIKKARIIRMSS
jgi:hypothetical protein